MTAIPPLNYPSTNYYIQEINLFRGQTVLADIISDGVASLQNGRLSGLIDPVTGHDAGTLGYLIESSPIAVGPEGAVQYIEDHSLQGTSNFTFDDSFLQADIITNGTVVISGGMITGLTTTSSDLDTTAGTKQYTDETTQLLETTLSINSSITYTGNQMVNGIILRDPVTESLTNTKFDTTASASSIISSFDNDSIGNSARFYIKNISTDPDVFVYLRPGTNVSFNDPIGDGVVIPQNYLLSAKLIIQSGSTILFYIESIEYSGSELNVKNSVSTNNLIPYDLRTLQSDSLKITQALWTQYYDYEQEELSTTIPWASIFYGQFTKQSQGSAITMYFPEPASSFYNLASSSGQYRFIFRNANATYPITLEETSGWIFDENASFVVAQMTSVLFWFYLDSETNSVTVYSIGKMSLD